MATTLRQHDQHAFLPLPENRLAVQAIKRLSPLTRRRSIQLVSLFGPPGVGKSRLCRELIRSWESKRSDGKIVYVTASEYAAQLAQASSDEAIHQFQQRYRKEVSLFVCEDLQSLAGRKETQQQLTAAVDDVITSGGCVLLTSTTMPSGIRELSSRLANRIHGGLSVDIPLPGASSRRKLVEHFLTTDPVRLTEVDISVIAQRYEVSPRELLGILNQIKAAQNVHRGETFSFEKLLGELSVSKSYSPSEIAAASAREFGVKVADLKSPQRSQTISTARQVAMYLTRELTEMNYKEIGEYFGRSNHSTVIHACNKIATQLQEDVVLSHNVQAVEKRLKSR